MDFKTSITYFSDDMMERILQIILNKNVYTPVEHFKHSPETVKNRSKSKSTKSHYISQCLGAYINAK